MSNTTGVALVAIAIIVMVGLYEIKSVPTDPIAQRISAIPTNALTASQVDSLAKQIINNK